MTRPKRFFSAAVALTLFVGSAAVVTAAVAPAKPSGRVVVLGFDGASHHLAQRFMDEGKMPNCKRLQDEGVFAPLGSANPAESPVAWASINTGMNPGKTNIFGFMRRMFIAGNPMPTIGYSRQTKVPLAGATSSGSSGSSTSSASGSSDGDTASGEGGNGLIWAAGGAVVLVLLLVAFRSKGSAAVGVLAVTLGGGGAYAAFLWEGDYTMPTHENDLKVKNFWDYLDDNGKVSRVMQSACNYPATGGQHTYLLSGLSTPDVGGGPGTYFIFTNNDWEFDRKTANGGKLIKFRIRDEAAGTFETRLEGPKQFLLEQKKKEEIAALKASVDAESDPQKKKKLEQKKRAADFAYQDWKDKEGVAKLAIKGTADKQAGTIRFQIADHDVTVKEGEWSEYLPITFDVIDAFPVNATVRFHVTQCNPDEDEVRFYTPAVTVAADSQPPNMPITSPASYGKELVEAAGHFDTIGWSCQTHAYKDQELEVGSFLSEIWQTIQWRRRMLDAQLQMNDWHTLFQVFGTPDRVCHMMYNFYDEKHPFYDAAEADKKETFAGRELTRRECIPAIYEEMDKTIGMVMERMDRGELGEDVTLMVVADHGFSPFREEVELNTLLIELGFMTLKEGTTEDELLRFVDWSKTKAYSMGLGTIYLNVKGREKNGIVEPADIDKVCEEIIEAMRGYRNPNPESTNDPQVVADAWKRDHYLGGPFAKDMTDDRGNPKDGPGDIQVGFNYGYRVAWGSALGNRETKQGPVFPNKSRWSGDHTTVHPYLVRGVFFSNKKLTEEAAPHLQDIAPTVLALQGVAVPEDMDGLVLPFPGLEEVAKSHKGNPWNRESLDVPPEGINPNPE